MQYILYILEEFGYAVCNRNMALVVVMQSVQSVFLAVFRLLQASSDQWRAFHKDSEPAHYACVIFRQ